MNHRTGKLIAADFDPSQDEPAPTFIIGEVEHTSDFGVLDVGSTFKAPAPLRDFDCERSWRWWPYACALAVLLGAVVPPLFAGLVR